MNCKLLELSVIDDEERMKTHFHSVFSFACGAPVIDDRNNIFCLKRHVKCPKL